MQYLLLSDPDARNTPSSSSTPATTAHHYLALARAPPRAQKIRLHIHRAENNAIRGGISGAPINGYSRAPHQRASPTQHASTTQHTSPTLRVPPSPSHIPPSPQSPRAPKRSPLNPHAAPQPSSATHVKETSPTTFLGLELLHPKEAERTASPSDDRDGVKEINTTHAHSPLHITHSDVRTGLKIKVTGVDGHRQIKENIVHRKNKGRDRAISPNGITMSPLYSISPKQLTKTGTLLSTIDSNRTISTMKPTITSTPPLSSAPALPVYNVAPPPSQAPPVSISISAAPTTTSIIFVS
ncbi:hypothetical protein BDN70DRAFT_935053 [Pholiota conissans]|uniref:Uncharacterized protein n=1 Tax=Pholiota conissans TaxID=109636 RepID=A0A9P5YWJ4_9AGAR|nr:hypothetical protein BDN70DRAFT_935053 [Pholiota conissans]